jgi:hypothetical protein
MEKSKEEEIGFLSYCSDMWVLGVIGMMRNMERWGCSTVELHGSATQELCFKSWSSTKHALN